jgi:uncharacterized protein (TIGR02118 family)
MIRVSILYPKTPTSHFDFDYYLKTHIPMAQRLLGEALKGLSLDRGLMGTAPNSPPAFAVMLHLLFDSIDDFMAAFLPHAETLQGDVKNYTDVEAVIQFNAIEMQQ